MVVLRYDRSIEMKDGFLFRFLLGISGIFPALYDEKCFLGSRKKNYLEMIDISQIFVYFLRIISSYLHFYKQHRFFNTFLEQIFSHFNRKNFTI